jgi:hypothetical protein
MKSCPSSDFCIKSLPKHVYYQCDFPKGRELSGHILTEYIKANMGVPDALDSFIDAILLADTLNFDEAKNAGVRWIKATMLCNDKTIFARDRIAKLAPLFAKEDSLFATVQLFIKSVVTKDGILDPLFLDPLFPELLVDKFPSYQKDRVILRSARGLKLSGSGCNADSIYFYTPDVDLTPDFSCCRPRRRE